LTEEPTDDLSKPLGQSPRKKRRFAVPLPLVTRAIAGALAACVAVVAGWILFVDEPFGGEPMVIISADTRTSPAKAGGETAPVATKPDAAAPPTALAEGDKPAPPGTKTVTIIDGTTGKRQEVTVAPPGGAPASKQGAASKPETKADITIDQRRRAALTSRASRS
jgi:hypothetical protein